MKFSFERKPELRCKSYFTADILKASIPVRSLRSLCLYLSTSSAGESMLTLKFKSMFLMKGSSR